MMNHICGDKAPDKSQGEVLNIKITMFISVVLKGMNEKSEKQKYGR